MRVLLFGDSLLKNLSKPWLVKLEEAIPGADVYNCSVGGWDTVDGVKKAPYIAKLKPDVVVLGFGTNDAALWKKVELDQYQMNLSKILGEFSGSRIIYFLPPPVDETKMEAGYVRTNDEITKYVNAAKEILDQASMSYINSPKIFGQLIEEGKDYHIEDGVHFNELGLQTLVDEIAKTTNSVTKGVDPTVTS